MTGNRFQRLMYSYKRFFKNRRDAHTRALRIPMQIPLRFRPLGKTEWLHGTTFNISQSGVMYRTEQALPLQTTIEMNYILPVEFAGKKDMEVFCKGQIVRAVTPDLLPLGVEPGAMNGQPCVAARILHYLPELK